ncbi:hypothetical protein [Nostoc sp.]|uniref:hypothetical protein n=1 Tax=Nostoc sp. TaxID=1180 RepID=UPI002FF538A3
MAEVCRDIDRGLTELQAAIERLNKRLDNLERKQNECCKQNEKDKEKNNNNNNSELEKRVKELEKTSEALKKGIVGALNNFADIEETNREFSEAFQGLYSMVTPLIDTVSAITGFLGGN